MTMVVQQPMRKYLTDGGDVTLDVKCRENDASCAVQGDLVQLIEHIANWIEPGGWNRLKFEIAKELLQPSAALASPVEPEEINPPDDGRVTTKNTTFNIRPERFEQ